MNILYIAYSCSPCNGSEDKIGWNIPLRSSQKHKVFILTKEEQRKDIEEYLLTSETGISVRYVDIPKIYKRLFGGPLYSGRLNIWNRRAFKVACDICREEQIDIIHQITPVEFRSIGDYGRIPGVKFICGPVAGGQSIPEELKSYTDSHRLVEWIRSIVNMWFRLGFRISGKLKDCDYLLLANQETKNYLHAMLPDHWEIQTDVAVDKNDLANPADSRQRPAGNKCRFLVVGRLIYLKGHAFLLDALARIPKELDYECRIVGEGAQRSALERKCAEMGLGERVTFYGAVPYSQVTKVYQEADVLVMPSFREATGSVLVEAMANGLPAITIDHFGGAAILDEDTGWLYDGDSREAYIEQLKDALVMCITRPEEVLRRGRNARKRAEKYTWDEKMKSYQSIYEETLKKD